MTSSRKEDTFVNKLNIKTAELFENVPSYLKPYFDAAEYPWEILPKIKEIAAKLLQTGLEGYTLLEEGVLVGKDVKIAKTATIIPPAIIGNGTEIRPGAFIRGNVIVGDNCVLGNSSEFKNCILLEKVQCPHYNYIGDSILGYHAHTGAGTVCSNLKSDGKNIVIHGDKEYETGLRKIGAFVGDYGDCGCNAVLNPGTIVGKHTQVYPLTRARGVYPENSIVKDTKVFVDKY